MLNGIVRSVKQDASRTATRGALFVYAGILSALACIFLASAIVISLAPVIGMGLALLCGGVFLLLLSGACVLMAMARGESGDKSSASAAGAGANVGARPGLKSGAGRASAADGAQPDFMGLLTNSLSNSLATGMLEKELRDHPVRMLAAALAAGTVMGIMEAKAED